MGARCWECGEHAEGLIFCNRCGKIQPPRESTFFAVLGLDERLELDLANLEASYYERSRLVHPDRHMARFPKEQELAAEQTELLNRAYRTLRDPWARTRYMLEHHGLPIAQGRLPIELAEEYFALQEAMSEGAASGAMLEAFQAVIDQALRQLESTALERRITWDALASKEKLAALVAFSGITGERAYLAAMRRDLARQMPASGIG